MSELRVFKKITLQQKAAFNNTLEHCVMPRKSFAAEPQYCNPCFSWDISHGPSGWFFSHEIQLDHRLLWYVGLQAKNIHYFWNMIITVQNRLFFHDLIRFYHISNKLILSLLWHLYSLMLFWCILYIYLIHSSVHACITICDLYTACLACAVTGKSFSLLWWESWVRYVRAIARPLCELSQFASLHPQMKPPLLPGKRRQEPSGALAMCMWGVRGLCSCKVEAPKSPSYRCVQTWVHKCLPVVKAEMGKMALKTGIKLPWKMRGNVLDHAWSDCCSTGVGEGWRQWWWVEEKIIREELCIRCETWKENPHLDIEMVNGGKWIPLLLLTFLTLLHFHYSRCG